MHPFTGLLSLAQERGWRVRDLFSCFEFDRDGRPVPGQHCSFNQVREIMLRASRLGGPELAAQSGARKSLPNLGIVGLGVLAQPRFGDALAFGVSFQRLVGSMLDVRLEVDGDEAALAVHDLFGDDETLGFLQVDHLITGVNALGHLPIERFALKRVELVGTPAPDLVAVLQSQVGCPITTNAAATRAVFSRAALDKPLRFSDEVTAAIVRQTCERELKALGLADAPASLRDYLLDDAGAIRSPVEMAREIGVSTRSLHRMLSAEGVKYAELAERVRIEKAKRLLTHGTSTDDVASALGYSDERSFRRAFERSTGVTPARFRNGGQSLA
jgi:AraC-like DNA-binding protein